MCGIGTRITKLMDIPSRESKCAGINEEKL